jgi:uncharacterized protein
MSSIRYGVLRSNAIAFVLTTLAAIVAAMSPATALAQRDSARKQGAYTQAVDIRPLAARGDAEAQYNLGLMYKNGTGGVRQNDVHAWAVFGAAAKSDRSLGYSVAEQRSAFENRMSPQQKKAALALQYDLMMTPEVSFARLAAADAGAQPAPPGQATVAPAQSSLPFSKLVEIYHRGDFKTALGYMRPLAEQGHPMAQYFVGAMYLKGEGVARDFPAAADWFRKSAEQNIRASQDELGLMYMQGKGVQKDSGEAAKWFRKAADQGSIVAKNHLRTLNQPAQ